MPAERLSPRRRTALLGACAFLAAAACAHPASHAIFDTANEPPERLAELRALADDPSVAAPTRRSAVIVVVDGLRADEARGLRVWPTLVRGGTIATVELPLPTLSRPYYHALGTGLTPDASGVRTNGFEGPARAPGLADAVRDADGEVRFVADRLDWFFQMFGRPGDGSIVDGHRFVPRVAEAVRWLTAAPRGSLLFAHAGAVDEAGHHHGVHTPERRRALRDADAALAAILRARGAADVALFVGSDHGHIDAGGHGGDEDVVRRVPFVADVPGVAPNALERPVTVEALAPWIAAAMGLPAPPLALAANPMARDAPPSRFAARRAVVARAHAESAQRLQGARGATGLALLLALTAIAAVARRRREVRTASAAALTHLAGSAIAHPTLLGRPFTLSAIDDVGVHGPRLALLGAASAIVALTASTRLFRGRDASVCALHAAAWGVGLAASGQSLVSIAQCVGSLSNGALDAVGYYAPIYALASGAGASVVAAFALGVVARRARS